MEGGEGDKPDLKIVHSSGEVEHANDAVEDEAFIRRQLTEKTSKLPPEQARIIWLSRTEESLEEAQKASGLSPEEFKRLFDEANRALYEEPQKGPKAADKPGHPSRSAGPKGEPVTGEADIIPFPKPPEPPDKPPQP